MEMNLTKPTYCTISPGILIGQKSAVSEFLRYSVPLFELQLGIILMMSHGLFFVLSRFGISMFNSQLLTGIILGPSLLGRFNFIKEVVFPIENKLLTEVAVFGFRLHIFLTVVDINLESAKRLTGKFAIITGLATILVPLAVGLAMMIPYFSKYPSPFDYIDQVSSPFMMMVLQSMSTFSVVVHVLKDLKVPNSEIGHLLLSSAMIFGGISAQVFIASTILFGGPKAWLPSSCAYIGFLIFAAFLVRPGINWIITRIPIGLRVDSSITCSLMLLALMFEVYCQIFILSPGIGAYVLGQLIPSGRPLGSALIEKFGTFSYGVLLPVSVAISAMKADFTVIFTNFGDFLGYVAIVVIIGVAKVLSCLLSMLFWRIPFVDSVLFTTLITNRGPIEVALLLFSREKALLVEPAYCLSIIYALANSLLVSIIVKRLYDPTKNYASYHDRNVMILKRDSPLRILVCVHDQDNIYSATRFLDAFRPTRERFLFLNVLHLLPLTGLNTPMIIAHNKKILASGEDTPSHDLIIHFNEYEQRNSEGVSISTYSSISPVSSMNEDISILAFDLVASIIILPFHRKLSVHGNIVSEDLNIRTINRKVLDKAPCSVAILLDRGKLGRRRLESSSLELPVSICVIFLGDKDDWEALVLAKRAAEDTSGRLTIIHFMLKNEVEDVESTRDDENNENGDDLDKKALEKTLKTYQQNQTNLVDIEYVPKFVKGGAETATVIRSVADKYDLFVVGRRYGIESPKTCGLSEWCEIPELGIVGDFLACEDANTRADVLVVHQQKIFRS